MQLTSQSPWEYLRRHQERDAEVADLVNFVEEETILVTDLMFAKDALDSFMGKVQRSNHRTRRVKTYATKTDITGEEEKYQSSCHMCKKNHDIDNCKKCLELNVNKRSRHLAKNKLFFGAMILSQVIMQQRHGPRELCVKNVRTIIQLLFMVISTTCKIMQQEKMMILKRKKLSCQIDAQK